MATRVFSDEEIRLMVGYEWAVIQERAAHASAYYYDIGEVPPLEISREKRVLGRCYYGRNPDGSKYVKKIRITQFFAKESDLRDTIRHEIAHALAYLTHTGKGHDHGWKQAAIFCGASPERCATGVTLTEPAVKSAFLTIGCPGCKVTKTFYRDCKAAQWFLRFNDGVCHNCGHRGAMTIIKHREPVRIERPSRVTYKPASLPVPMVPEE